MRLRPNSVLSSLSGCRRSGYTLVEILVATALTLILMTAVVSVFGGVGNGISSARRALDQFDRQRTVIQQLRYDLQGFTVKMDGRPARPEEAPGYIEIIEGGPNATQGVNSTSGGGPDSTVGECGDIIMLTSRNAARPFQGQCSVSSIGVTQSDVAEVAWFVRGKTLHRRVLLVAPGLNQVPGFANQSPSKFFQNNDISVRLVNGQIVANSLADLTKRENRFAHSPSKFPFDARVWGALGLPTMAECSSSWMNGWTSGTIPSGSGPKNLSFDYWDPTDVAAKFGVAAPNTPDQALATDGTRISDDVVLTNVIGFDVKVWEPAANGGVGDYVDLGYGGSFDPAPPSGPTVPRFGHTGAPKSGLQGPPCVYDSGNFASENEGIYDLDGNGKPTNIRGPGGQATNGLDDDGSGVVDDASETLTQPPYPVPLRGIQVKIRCYEPDSRQVREVTIKHDFLPK